MGSFVESPSKVTTSGSSARTRAYTTGRALSRAEPTPQDLLKLVVRPLGLTSVRLPATVCTSARVLAPSTNTPGASLQPVRY